MAVEEGVTATPAEYVERALSLGADRALRASVRADINAAALDLFDRLEPARELGASLLQMVAVGT